MAAYTPPPLPIAQTDVQRQLGGVAPYVLSVSGNDSGTETLYYDDAIGAVVAEFERDTRIWVTQRTVRMMPSASLVAGEMQDDAINLRHSFTGRSPRWVLRFRPVGEVLNCRFAFDVNNQVINFPTSWLRVNYRQGIVSVVPYSVAAPMMGSSAMSAFMPFFGMGNFSGGVMPQFVAIDYTAGYTDAPTNPDLADLRLAMAQEAARRVLKAVWGATPNSVNLDGFSQTFDAVKTRLDTQAADWKAFKETFAAHERPLVVGILGG